MIGFFAFMLHKLRFLSADSFKHCLFLVAAVCTIAMERTVAKVNVGRIIGGENVTIDKVPYIVSLRCNGTHGCGGTLITELHVLTAAHCLGTPDDYKYFTVMAGSTFHAGPGDVIDIARVDIHPNFDKSKFDLDAAVLTLARKPTTSLPITPIQITKSPVIDEEDIYISGWGVTKPKSKTYSPNLQAVWLEAFPQYLCIACFSPGAITENMFCAGFEDGGKDACIGDSGGPAIVYENWLVGIISWGIGCAEPWRPGVYTRVSVIYDWVKSITSRPLDDPKDKKG